MLLNFCRLQVVVVLLETNCPGNSSLAVIFGHLRVTQCDELNEFSLVYHLELFFALELSSFNLNICVKLQLFKSSYLKLSPRVWERTFPAQWNSCCLPVQDRSSLSSFPAR